MSDDRAREERTERLLVLSGGVAPQTEHTIPKVMVVKDLERQRGTLTIWVADLVFTDVGLLLVPYATFHVQTEAGKATQMAAGALAGGLVGVLVAGAGQAATDSTARKGALVKYERQAAKDQQLPAAERFATSAEALFLRADLIEDWKCLHDQATIRAGGGTYSLEHAAFKNPGTVQYLNQWLAVARAKRAALDGAGPSPGCAALVAWAEQPPGLVPAWVPEAVERAESSPMVTPGPTFAASAPMGELLRMGERLAAVGLEGSEGLLTKVARAIRAAALRTVAAGVALAIVGALFLVGGLPPMGGRQESVTPLGALAVIVGALALASALVVAIVGLCWLGRARRVNRRPTEPDLAQHST